MKTIFLSLCILAAVVVSNGQEPLPGALQATGICPPSKDDTDAFTNALTGTDAKAIHDAYCNAGYFHVKKCLEGIKNNATLPAVYKTIAEDALKLGGALCSSCRPEFFMSMLILPLVAFLRNM